MTTITGLVEKLQELQQSDRQFVGFHGSIYVDKKTAEELVNEIRKLSVKIELSGDMSALEKIALRFLLQS
jgi:hypothetical protein